SHGNFYVAGFQDGVIRVFNAKGDSIGRIVPKVVTSNFEGFQNAQGNVSNITFGGPDMKTMYFTGDGGLYSLRMKIPGRVRPGFTTSLRPRIDAAKSAPKAFPPSTEFRDLRGRLLSADESEAAPR